MKLFHLDRFWWDMAYEAQRRPLPQLRNVDSRSVRGA